MQTPYYCSGRKRGSRDRQQRSGGALRPAVLREAEEVGPLVQDMVL